MACTRNKNTYCDYVLEQRNNSHIKNYTLYPNASNGQATSACLPTVIYMPSHLPRDVLSKNPVDIESQLFGINSCNLVNKVEPVVPQLECLPMRDYFKVNREILLPEPLMHELNQRPFPI